MLVGWEHNQGKESVPAATEYNDLLLLYLLRHGKSIDEARHGEDIVRYTLTDGGWPPAFR